MYSLYINQQKRFLTILCSLFGFLSSQWQQSNICNFVDIKRSFQQSCFFRARERVNINLYCKMICSSVSCFCSYFFCKFKQFSHMQWRPCMLMVELTTLFSCIRRETLGVPNTIVPYAGFAHTLKVLEFWNKNSRPFKVLENCSWCWKVLEFQC